MHNSMRKKMREDEEDRRRNDRAKMIVLPLKEERRGEWIGRERER